VSGPFEYPHSSAADSLPRFIVNHLRQADEIQSGISPNFLARNWSPVFKEWSTRAVRDAFYASPAFPRLLNADAIKQTIARGVQDGVLAYVTKGHEGRYQTFIFERSMQTDDVEISDDVSLITRDTASAYIAARTKTVADDSPVAAGPVLITVPDGAPTLHVVQVNEPEPGTQQFFPETPLGT